MRTFIAPNDIFVLKKCNFDGFLEIVTKDLAWRVKILTSACDVEFAADCRPCSKFSAITHTKLTAVEIRSIPHGK